MGRPYLRNKTAEKKYDEFRDQGFTKGEAAEKANTYKAPARKKAAAKKSASAKKSSSKK